ncbi:Fis family transcriptional regulator [Sorangium cellulosum]|uniref:Fis family transcriptional regulator n=1 Tax=Sorangium cellulosum TaxID=56 RepID=A0A150R0A0_SORCE|nr:Fis family transcriptional regulator [Sorangium cellulosum]
MKTLAPRLARFAWSPLVPALALSLTAGCGGSSDDESTAGEPPRMSGITEAHNRARAAVEPPADTPLPGLTWSREIAEVAQAYADRCVFDHSESRYGENLYRTGRSSVTPEEVVAAWVDEAANYDLASNGCSSTCGHYTQVVWADSLRLGCGVADCTGDPRFGGGAWQIWVCNYDPPGNFVGERPY